MFGVFLNGVILFLITQKRLVFFSMKENKLACMYAYTQTTHKQERNIDLSVILSVKDVLNKASLKLLSVNFYKINSWFKTQFIYQSTFINEI